MATSFAGGTDRVVFTGPHDADDLGAVAFWMKTTQTTTIVGVAAAWTSGSRNGWGILLNNVANKITVQGYGTSNVLNIASTTSVNDGNWHHIVFNKNAANGGANEIYVDGVQEVTANASGQFSQLGVGNSCYIGDNIDTFWNSYNGLIAEFAQWYYRKLTADEIVSLAKGFPPHLVARDALKHYAPFVRSDQHRWGSVSGLSAPFIWNSTTGTTFADHPRVFGGTI